MDQYCFGIDVGGTTIKCGLFRTNGELLEKWEIPTRTENNGECILPDVASAILEMIEKRQLNKESIVGVGIGVPGPVTSAGTVEYAVNIHWGFKDLVGELSLLLGLEIKAANDANIAALGEMWKGGGGGSRNLIMVTLGTGVGGGIIVDGKIVAGAHGAAGEIGHARVDPLVEETCNCGNQGCLEQKAAAPGIIRMAKQELHRSTEDSLLRRGDLSAKAVFDAWKQNDMLAVHIVDMFAETLGNALAIFSTVVDPDIIVIGGGVSKAGPMMIDEIKRYYRRDAFPACKDVDIVLAMLGNDAGIYGAAKLILDSQ